MRIDTERKQISIGWTDEAKEQTYMFLKNLSPEERRDYMYRCIEEAEEFLVRLRPLFDEPSPKDIPSCGRY